jgi:carboxylesterase
MAGAEPFSATGGPEGVLVLHGFTGNPFSMRPLAESLAKAGHTVELPLLPGHGTAVDDMLETGWADWSAATEVAYLDLAARCESVAVAGLSMGGTLSCWLAERHTEISGIAVINPLVEPPTDDLVAAVRSLLDAGTPVMDGIGSDIALPDASELSYAGTPVAPLLSLVDPVPGVAALEPRGPRGAAQQRRPAGGVGVGSLRAGVAGAQLPRRHPRLRPRGDRAADGGLRRSGHRRVHPMTAGGRRFDRP